ncbi:MAG: hypothetical protein GY862_23735 [Gammaproteobacteria bacterium]|nr:hypothetical protein [Gammaproteobacteria bacterium]
MTGSGRSTIRRALNRAFDAVKFESFCSDHFEQVHADFTQGLDLSQKHTKLLDYCSRNGFQKLLDAVGQELKEQFEYEGKEREETQDLADEIRRYLFGDSSNPPAGAINPDIQRQGGYRKHAPQVDDGALINPGLTTGTVDAIDELFRAELPAYTDPSRFREAELLFLDKMERFIAGELRKSGDRHFVELSMQLARPDSGQSAAFHHNLSLALMVSESGPEKPDIQSRSELHSILLDFHHMVLLAPPGSGKTTVLHHLTLYLIGEYRRNESALIPVFVPLTKYGIDPSSGKVSDISLFLRNFIEDLCGPNHFLVKKFNEIAEAGRFLFILDGLDQMPNRRSETARLERMHAVETELRRMDRWVKIARLFRRKEVVSSILQGQRIVTGQLAPQIDPREQQIERLANMWPGPVITSCRIHDFIGVPNWQKVQVLPMSLSQVKEFVNAYAPEAMRIVQEQWDADEAGRSLVRNPFYLRMLTKAADNLRHADGSLPAEFHRVLKRRGLLLSHLIWTAIRRELENDGEADSMMNQIGELAYYMLSHNIIGALPEDALQRNLGGEYLRILRIAQNAGLVELKEGTPLTLEFNHQLFLEILLAFHLKERSVRTGGFEESLALLARQGDRWAETIKLLFEMVDEKQGGHLIDKCIEALRNASTWDIATRILSDVGHQVASRLLPLLKHENELTRQGVVNVLGRINAIEYTGRLAELYGDPAWQVRRAAIEALARMGRIDRLKAFDDDPKPIVIRTLFRNRLLYSVQPGEVIYDVLNADNSMHREQAARAIRDVFSDLVKRTAPESIQELLLKMMESNCSEVKILGYMTAAEAPSYIRRRLKSKLLEGALRMDDKVINHLARNAVSDMIDDNDLNDLKELKEKTDVKSLTSHAFKPKSPIEVRAYWLVLEVEEKTSLTRYFDALSSALPEEIHLLTQRLAGRGDSSALGILTYLLGNPDASMAAFQALISMGRSGIGHILAALDDPLPQVRLAVVEKLKFCHLPRRYARRVREELHRNEVTHRVVLGITEEEKSRTSNQVTLDITKGARAGSLLAPIANLFAGTGYWLASWIFSLGIPWSYWIGFAFFNTRSLFSGGISIHQNTLIAQQIEKVAFVPGVFEPDPQFWLARGKLLSAIGKQEQARVALNEGLSLEPTFAAIRYELALIHRQQEEPDIAKALLEADGNRYIQEKDSDLAILRDLVTQEMNQMPSKPSADDDEHHLSLLIKLRLWDEALRIVIWIIAHGTTLPGDLYYRLYQCYIGTNRTARALAAALINNEKTKSVKIPQVDIDNLRWLHRLDGFPADLQGRFGIFQDIGKQSEALDLLRVWNVLPADEQRLSQENIDNLHDLPVTIQGEVIALLRQMDQSRAAEVCRACK